MKSAEIRDRILVAMLTLARKSGFRPYEIASSIIEARVNLAAGMDELIVAQLSKADLIDLSDEEYSDPTNTDSNEIPYVALNWNGIQAAEALLDLHPEYDTSSNIPAADRYVSADHNQNQALQSDLDELEREILATNDVADEYRQIALAEIAVFESTIAQPFVSTVSYRAVR